MVEFIVIAIIGFFAALIDGGLGMGFGPITTSFLLSLGIHTAAALAAVNLAQAVTALSSAAAHIKMKNVDWNIVKHLVIGSIPGGILGALIAVHFADVADLKVAIAFVLIIMGVLIIKEAAINQHPKKISKDYYKLPPMKKLLPVGFIGGLCSSLFGSWGPIVVPPLLMYKSHPHITIGSVNTAEFVIRSVNFLSFWVLLQSINYGVSLPLIIGGVIAAPIATFSLKKTQIHIVGWFVGILIILLSLYTIINAFTK